METAKIFTNGKSQAVRLPKKFRFTGDEVYVQKVGETVILIPKDVIWQTFLDGLNSFTDDFMSSGREPNISVKREDL